MRTDNRMVVSMTSRFQPDQRENDPKQIDFLDLWGEQQLTRQAYQCTRYHHLDNMFSLQNIVWGHGSTSKKSNDARLVAVIADV